MEVKVDLSDFEDLVEDLRVMRREAIPHAMRQGLNDEAFSARKAWQTNLQNRFTLRNRFTQNSIRVEKARGTDLSSMESRVGTVAPYLLEQEQGATVAKSAIPTGVASGEGRIPGSARKRPVRRPNLKKNIRLPSPVGGPGKRGTAIAISKARRKGQRFVLLEEGRRKGIFKLAGGKTKPRLDMVYDLSRRSITKRPAPTFQPALETARRWAPGLHRRALIQQFHRAGLHQWV